MKVKNLIFVCALLMFIFVTTTVVLSDPANSFETIVRNFYQLRERTLDERGTRADVQRLIALMTDDVRYEHPVANVTMTKAEAQAGLMAHLNEGKRAQITLRNIMTGADFAVVELTLQYDVPGQGGKTEHVARNGVSILKFTNGKIQRIAEY